MEHPLLDHVLLRYNSTWGAHKMLLPTRTWSAAFGPAGVGGYTAWDTSTIAADDMIEALVTLFLAKFPATVHFTQWQVMQWDAGAETWNPVAGAVLTGFAGTDDDPGWSQAVQGVYTFYDTAFQTFKLNLLDMSSRNNFARRASGTYDADEIAIFDELEADTNAWASRAGNQLTSCRSGSLGINDELKKQYPGI